MTVSASRLLRPSPVDILALWSVECTAVGGRGWLSCQAGRRTIGRQAVSGTGTGAAAAAGADSYHSTTQGSFHRCAVSCCRVVESLGDKSGLRRFRKATTRERERGCVLSWRLGVRTTRAEKQHGVKMSDGTNSYGFLTSGAIGECGRTTISLCNISLCNAGYNSPWTVVTPKQVNNNNNTTCYYCK